MTTNLLGPDRLRNRAISAYIQARYAEIAKNEAEIAKESAAAEAAFLKSFKFGPDSVEGDLVICGTIALRHCAGIEDFNGNSAWRLLGNCPNCGRRVESDIIFTLEHIGELLHDFKADFHQCKRPEADKTPAERLYDAIMEVVLDATGRDA